MYIVHVGHRVWRAEIQLQDIHQAHSKHCPKLPCVAVQFVPEGQARIGLALGVVVVSESAGVAGSTASRAVVVLPAALSPSLCTSRRCGRCGRGRRP